MILKTAHRCAALGWLLIAVAGIAFGAPGAQVQAPSPCLAEPRPKPVTEAEAAVDQEPAVLELRLNLADALIAAQCYPEAVEVLETATKDFPQSRGLETRLRDARSLLEEQGYFADLERAEELAGINYNLLRCRRLNDLAACDEALRARPGDAEALIDKGNALLKLNRPNEALPLFSEAAESEPPNETAQARLQVAQDRRQAALATCLEREDEAALDSCDRALLRGAEDEFSVHKRRGYLLQHRGDSAQALDAYIAANALRGDDPAVAQAIVSLSESTGRDDPVTLAMRGGALLNLGQRNRAIVALREALALDPDLTDAEAQLDAAEKQRSARVATCRDEKGSTGLAACEDALLAGEADEFDIRMRMTELLIGTGSMESARTALAAAAALRPDDAVVQARRAELASHLTPATLVASNGEQGEAGHGQAGRLPETPIVISKPPQVAAAGAEVSTPARYSNAALASGRTH